MSDIPSTLFLEILCRLPPEPLLRFRAVCKEWRRMIDDPDFIKLHLHRQTNNGQLLIRNQAGMRLYALSVDSIYDSDFTERTIQVPSLKTLNVTGVHRLPALPVTSCNGLMLMARYHTKTVWVLWNPFTRDFLSLPPWEPVSKGAGGGDWCCGLGFDSVSDDYKVVKMGHYLGVGGVKLKGEALVYSLKLDSWKRIKDCPCDVPWYRLPGFYANGMLYWLTSKGSDDVILSIDLGTEDFRLLPLPAPPSGDNRVSRWKMNVLGGCLFVSHSSLSSLEGWVMKDCGGTNTWTELYSVTRSSVRSAMRDVEPVAYLQGKGQVLLRSGFKKLFWYDVEKKLVKETRISGIEDLFTFQVCSASLVQLNVGGGWDEEEVPVSRATEKKRKRDRLKLTMTTSDDWQTTYGSDEDDWRFW